MIKRVIFLSILLFIPITLFAQGPMLLGYSPDMIYYGRSESITIRLYHPSGINPDNAYIQWSYLTNIDTNIVSISLISEFPCSSYFLTDIPLPSDTLYSEIRFRVFARDNTPENNWGVTDWQRIRLRMYTLSPQSYEIDLGAVCVNDSVTLFQKAVNTHFLDLQQIYLNTESNGKIEIIPRHFPSPLNYQDSVTFEIRYKPLFPSSDTLKAQLYAESLIYPILTLEYTVLCTICNTSNFSSAPNPFSPNNDGVNDEFILLIPWDGFKEISFFDRKMQKIREIRGYESEFQWKGYADNGKPQPPGIYYYFVKIDGVIKKKGTVVLAR